MNSLDTKLVMPELRGHEIDFFTMVNVLWRGKLRLLIYMIIVGLLGGYYAVSVATPIYPAGAVVALATKQQQVLDIESVLSGGQGGSEAVNTEVEVIRSRNLITALVEDLNLVDDEEFNESLKESSGFNPVGAIKSVLGLGGDPKTEAAIFNDVVDTVISVISVSNIRQSLVFTINVRTEDPDKSALIANTLADLYIQSSLNEKFIATEQASKWLSEKVAELKLELEASETKMKAFSDGTQLISAEALAGLSIQLKEMRERISDFDTKRVELEVKRNSINAAAQAKDYEQVVKLANNTRLATAFTELKAGNVEQATFDLQVSGIVSQIDFDISRLNTQRDSIAKAEVDFQAEINEQSADLIELQQLQREAQANGLLYESFLSRLKETAVQQGLQQADSRLLSSAVPQEASSPKTLLIILLSSIIGLIIGSGILIVKEMRNNTFRTADDLESYTEYNVLGSIPKVVEAARDRILEYTQAKPTSVFAEAVRNLRTSILLSDVDNPPQVIMSTSSVPNEGKTTMALTLAQNISALNKKVLIIEGDVRKRVFKEYFKLDNPTGFVSVMADETAIDDAVYKSSELGADILIGEKPVVNAADLFSSVKFADLLEDLRKKYDYIIIDTAPVLSVPDARIIARHADVVIYSVRWNSTTKTQVKQGLSMFENLGLQIGGLVFNQIDGNEMKSYGYANQYGYAYGKDDGYYEN